VTVVWVRVRFFAANAPARILRPFDEPSPTCVSFHVTTHDKEVFLILNGKTLVTLLVNDVGVQWLACVYPSHGRSRQTGRPIRPSAEVRSSWLNFPRKILSFSIPNRFISAHNVPFYSSASFCRSVDSVGYKKPATTPLAVTSPHFRRIIFQSLPTPR